MSNLGMYQTITTVSKKMGGPLVFLGTVAVGGYAILRTGEAIGKKVVKKVRSNSKKGPCKSYTVKQDGESNEGLEFKVGQRFRVLGQDGDAVLIEKVGDKTNPYYVSAELLERISDFE